LRVLYFSVVIIFVDQISKLFIKGINIPFLGITINGMRQGSSISIIDKFFNITFIENPGMAFGMEIGSKTMRSIFTICASLLIIYFIYKNRKEIFYLRFSLALILGGAIGNLIDRIFYGVIYGTGKLLSGNVVDFFQLNIPDLKFFGKTFYSWPIFNIADVAITAGFLMIIFGYRKIFTKKEVAEQLPDDLQTSNSDNQPIVSETINILENNITDSENKTQSPI
jgi:signal peptidase II